MSAWASVLGVGAGVLFLWVACSVRWRMSRARAIEATRLRILAEQEEIARMARRRP